MSALLRYGLVACCMAGACGAPAVAQTPHIDCTTSPVTTVDGHEVLLVDCFLQNGAVPVTDGGVHSYQVTLDCCWTGQPGSTGSICHIDHGAASCTGPADPNCQFDGYDVDCAESACVLAGGNECGGGTTNCIDDGSGAGTGFCPGEGVCTPASPLVDKAGRPNAPYVFGGAPTNLTIDTGTCGTTDTPPRIANAVKAGGQVLHPYARRYLGTFRYRVSDCAMGDFNLVPRELGTLNTVRRPDDSEIAVALIGDSVHVDGGLCCDGLICLNDANSYCCTQTKGGTLWNTNSSCAAMDPCACSVDSDCNDPAFCNGVETCVAGVCVPGVPPNTDDGNACTRDTCNESAESIEHAPLADGTACGNDTDSDCDDPDSCQNGVCASNHAIDGTPCDDGLECNIATVCADGVCGGGELGDCADLCVCTQESCDMVFAHVTFGACGFCLAGAQFLLKYDPTCLDFVEIEPVAPWTMVLFQGVDEVAGEIFYAVSFPIPQSPSDPKCSDDPGTFARIKFNRIDGCERCELCFMEDNPRRNLLTDDKGEPFDLELPRDITDLDGDGDFSEPLDGVPFNCSSPECKKDSVALTCPAGAQSNVDCDTSTAIITWPPVTALHNCFGFLDLNDICTCTHSTVGGDPTGFDCDHLISTGGEFPQGHYEFACAVPGPHPNACSEFDECAWVVDVSDQTTLDVEVQLSSLVIGDKFERCICFEFFASCAPEVSEGDFCETMHFGLPLHFRGHGEGSLKVPKGSHWACITARDRQHSLRATDLVVCGDVSHHFEMVFKGDPLFGGNWLIQGNLNGDHVIDILDFGVFLSQYNYNPGPGADKTCDTFDIHADINGDGVVTIADFTFIQQNFLTDDKDACCPDEGLFGGSTGSTGSTEISVQELREQGLEDLIIADLNADGLLNTVDMTLFLEGARPDARKGATTARPERVRR